MTLTIFRVIDDISLIALEKKLKQSKGYVEKKVNPINGDLVDLKITIEDIKNDDKHVRGTMYYDYLDQFRDRDGDKCQIKTRGIDFTFLHGSGIYLIIHSSVKDSCAVAHNFIKIVFFTKLKSILSCDITPPAMQKFLGAHRHTIFSCTWDELNIPGLTGTNLKGGQIESTTDFIRYERHGMKKSVMVNLIAENITMSINRNAGVHFYTNMNRDSMEQFIRDKIIPICR